MFKNGSYIRDCVTGVVVHRGDELQRLTGNVSADILPRTPVVDDGIHDVINRGIKFAENRLPPLATIQINETARGTGFICIKTRQPFYENVAWAYVPMQDPIEVEMLVAYGDSELIL